MINSNNDRNSRQFQSPLRLSQQNILQKQLFTPVEQTIKGQDKYREQFQTLKQKYQMKKQIREQSPQLEKLKHIPLEKQKSLIKSARIKSTSKQRQKYKQKQRQRQLCSQLEQTLKQQKQLYKKLKLISLIKSDYNSLKKIHNSPQVFGSHLSSNNSNSYSHQASPQINGKYAQPSDCYIPYKHQRKIQSEMKINKNVQKDKQGKNGKKWDRVINAKANTEEILYQDNQNFSKRSRNIEQKYLQMQNHYHQQYSNRVRNNTEGNQSKSKNKYKNKNKNNEILSVCKIKMLQSVNKTPQRQKSIQKLISKQINPLKYNIKSASICQCRCTCCQNIQQNCPCTCMPSSFQSCRRFSILKHNRSLTEQISLNANNQEGIKCQKASISEQQDGRGYQSERRAQENEGMDRVQQKYQSAFITDNCTDLARKMLSNWKKQIQLQYKTRQAQSLLQLQLGLELESGLQKTKLKSIPKSRLHFEVKKSAQKSQIQNGCQNENQKESDRKEIILNFYRKKSNKSKTVQTGNGEDNKKNIEKIKAEKAQQKCVCKCECKYNIKNGLALDEQFISKRQHKLKEINDKDEVKSNKQFENICKATLKGWTRYHGAFGQNETNNFY